MFYPPNLIGRELDKLFAKIKEELLEASIMSVDNYKVLIRILETCVE